MSASRIHAVIAAAIQNPELISRWEQQPSQLLAFGIEPGVLDLSGLRKFSGLTVKVRHNALRVSLPCTFRLMQLAGMDIALFAAYAVELSVRGETLPGTDAQRAERLVKFFGEWRNLRDPHHQLLWDIIRHEYSIMRLREAAPAAPVRDTSPRVCGSLLLHEMCCDPRAAEAVLRQAEPDLTEIERCARYFGYWRAEAVPDIVIVELDEFAYYALSFADGRPLGELCAALTGKRRPTRVFMRTLDQLRDAGLLTYESPPAVEA